MCVYQFSINHIAINSKKITHHTMLYHLELYYYSF